MVCWLVCCVVIIFLCAHFSWLISFCLFLPDYCEEEVEAGKGVAAAVGGVTDASATASPAVEGVTPRRRRLSLTVHAALVAASQRRSSLTAVASPVSVDAAQGAAAGAGAGAGAGAAREEDAAVEEKDEPASAEDDEPTLAQKTPEAEEQRVEVEAAAAEKVDAELSAVKKKKKKKKKKMVAGEIGPPPSVTSDGGALLAKEKKKKKKKKSDVPLGLQGKPKVKAPKVVEM